jgi:hypothetical protein
MIKTLATASLLAVASLGLAACDNAADDTEPMAEDTAMAPAPVEPMATDTASPLPGDTASPAPTDTTSPEPTGTATTTY